MEDLGSGVIALLCAAFIGEEDPEFAIGCSAAHYLFISVSQQSGNGDENSLERGRGLRKLTPIGDTTMLW